MNEPHSLLRFAFSRHGTSVPVAAFRLGVFTRYVGVDVVMESLTVLGKWVDDHLQAAVREACRTLGGYYGDDYKEVEVFVVLQLQKDADAALARDEVLHALYHLGAVLGRWLDMPDRDGISALLDCIQAHRTLTQKLQLLDENLPRTMKDRAPDYCVDRLLEMWSADRGLTALLPECLTTGPGALPLKLKALINLMELKIATVPWATDNSPPLPDGPYPPNRFRWGNDERELPPLLWRLLNHLWACPCRQDEVEHVMEEVWRRAIKGGTLRSAVWKLNQEIRSLGFVVCLENGYVCLLLP